MNSYNRLIAVCVYVFVCVCVSRPPPSVWVCEWTNYHSIAGVKQVDVLIGSLCRASSSAPSRTTSATHV